MSDKELKVMESKVREAMSSCPQAKAALEAMFGEQLTPEKFKFQVGDIVKHTGSGFGVVEEEDEGRVLSLRVLFFDTKGFPPLSRWVQLKSVEFVYRPKK